MCSFRSGKIKVNKEIGRVGTEYSEKSYRESLRKVNKLPEPWSIVSHKRFKVRIVNVS